MAESDECLDCRGKGEHLPGCISGWCVCGHHEEDHGGENMGCTDCACGSFSYRAIVKPTEPHITPAMVKRLVREMSKRIAGVPKGVSQHRAIHHGADAWANRENARVAKGKK